MTNMKYNIINFRPARLLSHIRDFRILLMFLVFVNLIACEDGSTEKRTDPQTEEPKKVFNVLKMNTPLWAKHASLYEVDIRTYTPQGTFSAFMNHLNRLKDMGVSVINLTSILPGDSSPETDQYLVVDHTKVDPELGTFEELKALIFEIHAQRMAVIMDWPSYYTSSSHSWKMNNPNWFIQVAANLEHGEVLDYAQENMQNTLIEAMKFWLRSVSIDGFRCLDADMVPNKFWRKTRTQLESVSQVFMVSDGDANPSHYESCFQANYATGLQNVLLDIASAKQDVNAIDNYFSKIRQTHPAGYYKISGIKDYHKFSSPDYELSRPAIQAITILAFTLEGLPILHNGMETNLGSIFAQPSKTWSDPIDERLFKKLLFLKRYNEAMWNGKDGGSMRRINKSEKVFAFKREANGNQVAVLVNVSNKKATTTVSEDLNAISDLISGKDYFIRSGSEVSLEPWQAIVLANPGIEF